MAANERYRAEQHHSIADARPRRHMAVVTCMDARIDVFAALGLQLGDAHVLRNAGGRATDDVVRSLAASSHVLGVDTVVLMQHTQCGMAGVTDDELRTRTGATIDFLAMTDQPRAMRDDLDRLMAEPSLALIALAVAFLFDVETGAITEIARRSREPRS